MRERVLRANLWIGLAGLAGASALLAAGAPFMKTWYFSFAWWSFILAMDGANVRRSGTSPLALSGGEFWTSAFLSVPVWLVFELANLRLRNWSYHGLPASLVERWAGYFIAYATVIPALRELGFFFEGLIGGGDRSHWKLRVGPAGRCLGSALGALLLALPLVWPKVFFPLIWLGFIFLLEPWNERRGAPSLLRDAAAGRWGRIWSWMAAGLAAGILWEFWNWLAGARWQYNLPCLNFGRIFQMPIFGYGGFIPFGLEIFALTAFLLSLRDSLRRRRGALGLAALVLVAFDVLVFYLIDAHSVVR
jgi:hypothetical protein